jgi:hypothetical protein
VLPPLVTKKGNPSSSKISTRFFYDFLTLFLSQKALFLKKREKHFENFKKPKIFKVLTALKTIRMSHDNQNKDYTNRSINSSF